VVFSGSAQTFKESFQSLLFALVLGIFVAYMVLGAQFNSFVHPFTVLLALPFSVTGAFIALTLTGITLNIYSMIGLLLLMGIVKKNSILLVEFTNERRKLGKDVRTALLEACPVRLRPILMTSVSTIAGAVPAALSLGAGAETIRPMAVVVIGGMIASTVLTLLWCPRPTVCWPVCKATATTRTCGRPWWSWGKWVPSAHDRVGSGGLGGSSGHPAALWVADVLNLRALRREPPPGFEDVYDAARYARSQDYVRAKTRFGFIVTGVGLLALLAFWFAGGFGAVDRWARGRAWGPVATGVVFLGVLSVLKSAVRLPFDVYATFRLEARFGFNRTTVKTFVLDRLKGLLLVAVLGGPILALLLWLFGRLGASAWLWAWGTVTVFSLLLQFIAPTVILPLFNKFTPLPDGELREAVFALAKKLNYPLAHLFVIDGSRRSSKGNAFFTGFGKNKKIALFDTLIQKQTVPELIGVLAHEIGHHKEHHVWKGFALGVAQTGRAFFPVVARVGVAGAVRRLPHGRAVGARRPGPVWRDFRPREPVALLAALGLFPAERVRRRPVRGARVGDRAGPGDRP
jgi:Zn-dependent protease with chaperone function